MRFSAFFARSSACSGRIVRGLVMVSFVWVAAQHWHPFYGFTAFLQLDPVMAERAIPTFQDATVYKYDEEGPYDGIHYAQMATDPSLRDPALATALDDVGYRGRRILLSALAWAVAGGDALDAVHVYAWLNVVLWLVLAGLLWRLLPVDDSRATLAWVLILAGAGVMFSVRLALTDLATLLLTTAGVMAVERGWAWRGSLWFGLAGLTRETGILGAAALVSPKQLAQSPRLKQWGLLALRGTVVLLPVVLWIQYVRNVVGSSSAGTSNLAWPLSGWAGCWIELFRSEEANTRLHIETMLSHFGLTVQLVYLAMRPRLECPWWRVGIVYAALCCVLGVAVWEGFPNATSRVLLPMTLAFNVLVVRQRAALAWLILGNLSVAAGVHALQPVPGSPHELPAHSSWSSRHLLRTDDRWKVAEWNSKHRWAWCEGEGGIRFVASPVREKLRLELSVRGRTPRSLEVWHGRDLVWSGAIGDRPQWIALPALATDQGELRLELRSPGAAVAEGQDNTARAISFALFGVRVVE